jgi:transmembrane sensor
VPAETATATATVTQLSPDTVLAPLPDREGRGYVLRAGGARFSVPHDPLRPFVVAARDVVIEDLGTTFTVRYVAADRLSIAVEEGRVRVRGNGTDTEVTAGAKLEVPVAPPAAESARPAPASAPASVPSWRRLAERGQYEEAQRALRKAGAGAVRDDTAELLLAADAARLSGHPAEAVPYLERIVRGHARDPRAGLVAFTLGRVLLDELGRPREAIEAFARARAAGGPLAEDALAREVEAVSRAGDVARCRELALLYQRLYPNGRRAKAVSRFGGID